MIRKCTLGFLTLLSAVALLSQTFTQDEIRVASRPYVALSRGAIRVQANLVEVGVVVRDSKNQPVAGLKQEDFEVLDNGKPQVVSAFSVEASAPPAPTSAGSNSKPPQPSGNPPPSTPAARPVRYIAFFFDDLNMQLGDVVPARTAAQEFIHSHPNQGDRIGVFTSSTLVTLEFTSDMDAIARAILELRPRFRRPDGGPTTCPRVRPYQAHLIVNLHDSDALNLGVEEGIAAGCLSSVPGKVLIVRQQAEETLSLTEHYSLEALGILQDVIDHLGRMPGRRMLVLTSAGFLTRTGLLQRRQQRVLESALRASVVINALDAKGLVTNVPGGEPGEWRPVLARRPDLMTYADALTVQQREAFEDPMAILAEGTGGRFFHNSNDLGRGFRELVASPEVSYLLGFSPADLKPDGRYHELKVKLTGNRPYTIQARRGYFAPTKEEQARASAPDKLDAAVLDTSTLSDFAADITTQPVALDSGESALRVIVHADARAFPFERRGDRSVEKVRMVTALFDPQGKFLTGVEGIVDLSLKDATLASISEHGLNESLTLQAPPGNYTLRVVVQETLQGRIAAFSRPVSIH